MRAGKFDRKVRIETFAEVDDGYNVTAQWATLADVPCQYIPSAGREARNALGQEATLPASFRLPWAEHLAAVTPSNRLRFPASDDGKAYDIKSVVEIGRREGIEIVAVAGDG